MVSTNGEKLEIMEKGKPRRKRGREKKKDIIDYFVTLIDDHDVRKRPSFKMWVENYFEV